MKSGDSIRCVIDELVNAWNRADARAFGGLFMQDADYIGTDGVAHHGRKAIEQLVQGPPQHLGIRIDRIVSIQQSADRAEARFGWRTESVEPARQGTIHLLVAKEPSGWRITQLRNTASA
jgi:uncharacterized protein (TIGR02246 family)